LTGGDLDVEEITGSKDIEATAGDVKIAAGNPNNYSKVDASVKVGDLSAVRSATRRAAFSRRASPGPARESTHCVPGWARAI